MVTKTYHISLVVEVLACIKVDSGCSEDAVGMIAREAISLFPTGREDTTLEIEHIEANDIIEATQEANNAR